MNTTEPRESRTARLNFLEAPSLVDQLQRRAIRDGCSLSDELRRAVRVYIASTETER
jgi:urease gamma subunit